MKITKISAILAVIIAFASMGALADSWSLSSGSVLGGAGFSGQGSAQTMGRFSGSSLSITSHDLVVTSDAGDMVGRTSGIGAGTVVGLAGASSMAEHAPGVAAIQSNAGVSSLAISRGGVTSVITAGAGTGGFVMGR